MARSRRLITFGYVVHAKQGNKRLDKLEDRSNMMVFIGYEPGSKAWRFYNPLTRRIHVSRDTVFEEDRAWSWNEDEIGDDEPFRVEYIAAGRCAPSGRGQCMARLASGHARAKFSGKVFTRERGNAHARV
jgi:hypothetical protein